MGELDIDIAVAPNATAYDADYPTRSTELYCNVMHNILQDCDDSGQWWISDDVTSTTRKALIAAWIHDNTEAVFDYAAAAIEDHRNEDPISITEPTGSTPVAIPPEIYFNEVVKAELWRMYASFQRTLYIIYYMWKTEEDPLLLKEKLQELLIAWPLHDITVELNEDMGQQFKVYPSWKNADL